MIAPVVDCGERCVDCGRDCGRGSDLFALAVPADVERERSDGRPGLELRRGWLCADCLHHLCDCGETAAGADVHWLRCAVVGCGSDIGLCPACWVTQRARLDAVGCEDCGGELLRVEGRTA